MNKGENEEWCMVVAGMNLILPLEWPSRLRRRWELGDGSRGGHDSNKYGKRFSKKKLEVFL